MPPRIPVAGLPAGLDRDVLDAHPGVVDHERAISGPGGLTIERDLYWRPRPLTECR